MAIGQIRQLRRPGVHLGVDVGGVLAAPGGIEVLVPDPLEVGRLRPRPARRDHQVAAVLHVEGDEAGILRPLIERAKTAVHGQALASVRSEVDPEPVEIRAVLGDVVFPDPLEALAFKAVQIFPGPAGRISADVSIIHEIRGRDEIDRGLARACHGDDIVSGADLAVGLDPEQGDPMERAVLHGDGQGLERTVGRQALRSVRRIQADMERQGLALVRGQADDDRLVGLADEASRLKDTPFTL